MGILETLIYRPMGYILNLLCMFFQGNFAVSIFFFTILVNAILLPLSIKQQKGMAGQARIKNKMDKLKEKYGSDKQRYNEETGKLYQTAGVNPLTGCLLTLIRLPFLLGIYNAVMRPLSLIIGMDSKLIDAAKKLVFDGKMVPGLKKVSSVTELQIIDNMGKFGDKLPALTKSAGNIDFNLFGLQLTQKPHFTIDIFHGFEIIWIIPILSFVTALISAIITTKIQKTANPDAPSMGGMLLMMPVFSLVISFGVPGAVGFYWACSNVVSTIIQVWVQSIYTPSKVIAQIEADTVRKRREAEKKKKEKVLAAAVDSE